MVLSKQKEVFSKPAEVFHISKSVRDDGRSLAIYTLRGKSSCLDALLPLLRNPVLTNKSKRQLLPWLEEHFPDFKFQSNNLSISGEWLAGFTDGDGSFYTVLRRQRDYRSGYQFQAVFNLAQLWGFSELHGVLTRINKFWFSETRTQQICSLNRKKQVDHLRLVRAQELYTHVIPFYNRYKLQSRKEIQFLLWKEAVDIVINKEHLSSDLEDVVLYRERCRKWVNA